MRYLNLYLLIIIVFCLAGIAIVSFHSVSEIHYLKTFYPAYFSVQDVAYASLVELIKVSLITLPVAIAIFVCLFLIRLFYKSGG